MQKDFNEGLDVSSPVFEIDDYTCNITSSTSIIAQLTTIQNGDYDMIALVRGGGDKQSFEVFNDLALAEVFLKIPTITITALGHAVDETLLDKLSDRRFHLPHDYGASLHNIINKLTEEKSNSRALLIDEVKKDVSKQFVEKVKTLETQLLKKNEEFKKLQEDTSKTITQLNDNTQKLLKNQSEEVEKYKIEFAALHDKNMKVAVESATASLQTKLELTSKENTRLQSELNKKRTNIILYIVLLIIGIVVVLLITKL